MLHVEKVRRTREEVVGFTCSRCGVRYAPEDELEWQEKLLVELVGGYSAVFGDGSVLTVELCQRCIVAVLGPFACLDGERLGEARIKTMLDRAGDPPPSLASRRAKP